MFSSDNNRLLKGNQSNKKLKEMQKSFKKAIRIFVLGEHEVSYKMSLDKGDGSLSINNVT